MSANPQIWSSPIIFWKIKRKITYAMLRSHCGLNIRQPNLNFRFSMETVCPGCQQTFRVRHHGFPYCCGHCSGNRGHGKRCPLRFTSSSQPPNVQSRHRNRSRSNRRDGRSRTDATRESNSQASTCVICLDSRSTHACIPCGHRCICELCADTEMMTQQKCCPVCRRDVAMVMRIFD